MFMGTLFKKIFIVIPVFLFSVELFSDYLCFYQQSVSCSFLQRVLVVSLAFLLLLLLVAAVVFAEGNTGFANGECTVAFGSKLMVLAVL